MIDCAGNGFSGQKLGQIHKKISRIRYTWTDSDQTYASSMTGKLQPSLHNVCHIPGTGKINNRRLYFAQRSKPFKTNWSRHLFYTDLFSFQWRCFSISRVTGLAIQRGPDPGIMPGGLYNTHQKRMVTILLPNYGEYLGGRFLANESMPVDADPVMESEIEGIST